MQSYAIDLGIIVPAFLAGFLVLLTHVPLGAQVLSRGIVFIDLAIAQIAALGVMAASMLELNPDGFGVQCAAGGAAIIGAIILTLTEKYWPEVQEAQIGVIFVLAATGGLLLLSHNPHGGEHLRDLLAGQILWVSFSDLMGPAIASLLILLVWGLLKHALGGFGFYFVFALAVTLSVQLVGVYLVFASLIVPSLAVRHIAPRYRYIVALLTGLLGYGIGLYLSLVFDLPSGALIVWCLVGVAILVYAFCPRYVQKESLFS